MLSEDDADAEYESFFMEVLVISWGERVRSWLAKFSIIYAWKYSNDIIDNVKDGDKSSPPPRPANDCLQPKHREICSSALFRILSPSCKIS